jgi:hypothetical protein
MMPSELLTRITECAKSNSNFVHSVFFVGSNKDSLNNYDSDIDCVFVLKNPIDARIAFKLGNAFSSQNIIGTPSTFGFNYSDCSKCTLTAEVRQKLHLTFFSKQEFHKALEEKDYLIVEWSKSHRHIWGKKVFQAELAAEINSSLLSEDEGIPGMLRDICDVLLTKDPEKNAREYRKTYTYHKKRLKSFRENFPDIFKSHTQNVAVPDFVNREHLLQLSKDYEGVQNRIKQILLLSRGEQPK